MQISCTPLPCPLGDKVYATYPVGKAFALDGRAKTYATFSNSFSLSLAVYPLTQALQITGRFYQFAAAFPFVRRVTVQQGSFAPRALPPFVRYSEPMRHRLAFSRFSGVSGYTASLAPPISRWDQDGFSLASTSRLSRRLDDSVSVR